MIFQLDIKLIALRSDGGGSLYRLQRDFVLRAASGAPCLGRGMKALGPHGAGFTCKKQALMRAPRMTSCSTHIVSADARALDDDTGDTE